MWRCHCGEKNLSADERCRNCNAARLTHEDVDGPAAGASRRAKTVEVSFIGLGSRRGPAEADPLRRAARGPRPGEAPTRALSDEELVTYYAAERRREILILVAWVLAALAVVGLLVWQIARLPR
jgi:hypothetical protein